MTELKFRGKCRDNGEWITGSYLDDNDDCSIVHRSKDGHLKKTKVRRASVGQYKGINDRNGAEVYGGDILKYQRIIYKDCSHTEIETIEPAVLIEITSYHPMATIIKPYSEGVKAFSWDNVTGEGLILGIEGEEIEVVGNIWDNPELIALTAHHPENQIL